MLAPCLRASGYQSTRRRVLPPNAHPPCSPAEHSMGGVKASITLQAPCLASGNNGEPHNLHERSIRLHILQAPTKSAWQMRMIAQDAHAAA